MRLAILQARSSSKRFPGKVLADLEGMPMIIRQVERMRRSSKIDKLVVATSTDPTDDVLTSVLTEFHIEHIRGPLDDVLGRFLRAIDIYQPKTVIRMTADCPLTDPFVIDSVVSSHEETMADYSTNTLLRTFPHGLDVECFTPEVLIKLAHSSPSEMEREHVTYGLYRRKGFCTLNSVTQVSDYSSLRWTVDYEEDLDFVRTIYSNFISINPYFSQKEIIHFLEERPDLKRTVLDVPTSPPS